MNLKNLKFPEPIPFVLFVAITAAISHMLFSWIGFNPTDEGFVLAGSRRLLLGQIPHVDFISIRPVGSSLLHIPEVLWGGDRTFYISRLVVLIQFAIVAYLWVKISEKILKLRIKPFYRILFALVNFVFCLHTFPLMAWATVDGIFLCTVGIYWSNLGNPLFRALGFFTMGLAVLCKQNFAVVPIGVFIINGYFKRPQYLLFAFLPSVLYLFMLWRYQFLVEGWHQITLRSELKETGFKTYGTSIGFWMGVLFPLAVELLSKKFDRFFKNFDFIFAIDLLIICSALLLFDRFFGEGVFAIFGLLLGYTLVNVKSAPKLRLASLILILAWAASVSLGYNSPVLMAGPMLSVLIMMTYNNETFNIAKKYEFFYEALLVLIIIGSFAYVRTQHVYRDLPADKLTADLDGVFPGAANINSNENFKLVALELDSIHQVYKDSLIILPDFSAWYVQNEFNNSFPMDWPNRFEIADTSVLNRLTDFVNNNKYVYALQKFQASRLSEGFIPWNVDSVENNLITYIERNVLRIDETESFYLYK